MNESGVQWVGVHLLHFNTLIIGVLGSCFTDDHGVNKPDDSQASCRVPLIFPGHLCRLCRFTYSHALAVMFFQ